MKLGIADYGWRYYFGGGEYYDLDWSLKELKKIGYEGIEQLRSASPAEAVYKAALFRRNQMDFGCVNGPDAQACIQWAAAMGKHYVWTKGKAENLDGLCRTANVQAEASLRWGIRTALHNHLGSVAESQAEVEEFLEHCPQCGLILDTAHLAAADGDPVEIVRKYPDRLAAIHVKDWLVTNPEISIHDGWQRRGRFCELGAGNIGLDNAAVMRALVEVGYDGWVFVEHDTHLRDPREDLAVSRQYLSEWF